MKIKVSLRDSPIYTNPEQLVGKIFTGKSRLNTWKYFMNQGTLYYVVLKSQEKHRIGKTNRVSDVKLSLRRINEGIYKEVFNENNIQIKKDPINPYQD